MEKQPWQALKPTSWVQRALRAAIDAGCERFVMISTDKAVNPTSVMGCANVWLNCSFFTKDQTDVRCVITRFGNVLGSNGSVIPLFKQQIERGGPITVTDAEVTRYFMTIPEAVSLVLEASAIGEK